MAPQLCGAFTLALSFEVPPRGYSRSLLETSEGLATPTTKTSVTTPL